MDDYRVIVLFVFLLTRERGSSLKRLFEERIVGTNWGEGKGDNLKSIKEIVLELENILNDRTAFNYDGFHRFNDIAYSLEMVFLGEKVLEDLPMVYDNDKEWIKDLMPKRKNLINLQGGDTMKAMKNLYDCQKAYDIVVKNDLWKKNVFFRNNKIFVKEIGKIKPINLF